MCIIESFFASDPNPFDHVKTDLQETTEKLLSTKRNYKAVLKSFLNGYDSLDHCIADVLKSEGGELIDKRPELRQRVEKELEGFLVTDFSEAPIVLYDSVIKADIFRSWREQLQANLWQIQVILRGDPKEMDQHQWIWYEDYREDRREFFALLQLRDCLREARKLAQLLTVEPKITRIVRSESLFKETFDEGLTNWNKFGESKTTVKDGQLHVKGSPVMLWTRGKPYEESCVVGVDFMPGGRKGGLIFAFPGSPGKGLDYSVSAGRTPLWHHVPPGNRDIMEPYNWGIHTYHVSVHRGRTHLRRTGAGLKMLNVIFKDPCAQKFRKYRIELLLFEESFLVLVNGKLIHAYVDAGVYGPILQSGHFGIKQFGNITGIYDNVQIHKLKVTD